MSGDSNNANINRLDSKNVNLKSGNYALKGRIIDFNTGEGIPFATLYIGNASSGTVADIDGNFAMQIKHFFLTDTLYIQALGYERTKRWMSEIVNSNQFIQIDLHRTNSTLNEFTINATGVDPALLLIKRIIAHKPVNNPDKAENYSCETFNRLEVDIKNIKPNNAKGQPILKNYGFVFNNIDSNSDSKSFLPVYLTEAISDYYYRAKPKKQREFIKGSLVKGVKNEEIVNYVGSSYQYVNIYNNAIPVLDKKFVSPISNDGPLFYRYVIKDTEKAYGHNIILVQFMPRRTGELCFSGDFWVVDSVYAIQKINMVVPKSVNMNWTDKISLYQEFVPVDTFWFCSKDKFIAEASIYGSKKIPGFIARKTTTYHNIAINAASVDSMLDNPYWMQDVIKADSVSSKSREWWSKNRPDTLTKNELSIHKMVDTILSMPITTKYINAVNFLVEGVRDFGPIQFGPYWYCYSNNQKEGDRIRLTLGTPRSIENLHLSAYLAYGFKDLNYKYGGDVKWIMNRKEWTYLYGIYAHDINLGVDNFEHVNYNNIFSGLVRKPNVPSKVAMIDLERVEYYKLYLNYFSYLIFIQHKVYLPYAPLPSQSIFTDANAMATNNVNDANAGIEFRYAYKDKYLDGKYKRIHIGSKYPVFDIAYTKGAKNILGSSYDYNKINGYIKETILTPPFGQVSYKLFAGKYFGKLPYPLLEVHPGNEYLYYDANSFEMMVNYEFISDEFVGFIFEHNFGGGIFNYIPLLKKMKLRQFWTAKGILGSLSAENSRLNLNKGYPFRTLEGTPYIELGTGVSNIFNIFRYDFVWRVMPKPIGSEAISKYFGIFVSVHFEF